MANDCIPFYEPGDKITVSAAAALTGKRCVAISANRQSGPGLSDTSEGGNLVVNYPSAGAAIFGVLAHDVAQNGKVACFRGNGFIVPITVGAGNISAWAEVEVDGSGRVIAKSAGVAIGRAVNAATSGNDAEIALY